MWAGVLHSPSAQRGRLCPGCSGDAPTPFSDRVVCKAGGGTAAKTTRCRANGWPWKKNPNGARDWQGSAARDWQRYAQCELKLPAAAYTTEQWCQEPLTAFLFFVGESNGENPFAALQSSFSPPAALLPSTQPPVFPHGRGRWRYLRRDPAEQPPQAHLEPCCHLSCPRKHQTPFPQPDVDIFGDILEKCMPASVLWRSFDTHCLSLRRAGTRLCCTAPLHQALPPDVDGTAHRWKGNSKGSTALVSYLRHQKGRKDVKEQQHLELRP